MGESTWAEISAQAKNHQSAWEKISGLKFQLRSRTISQPNGGTRKITQGKFYLSTYKDPTGRTLPCENQRDSGSVSWVIDSVLR